MRPTPRGPNRIREVRVSVDEDLCAATGECERICPDVFQVDDVSRVLTPDPNPALHEAVRMAEASCPTGAIVVTE